MILLDTNALLHTVAAPEKLGPKTTAMLQGAAVVHVSAISHVEIHIKQMKGRLRVPPDFSRVLAAQGFTALPLREVHAAALTDFPELADHDPFDRQLVAQASVEGLRFVTSDEFLLDLGYDWIIDARV